MLIADDRRQLVNGNAAACELLATCHTDLPWCTLDEFTAPSERARLRDQWAPFLTRGAAEGWYELVVPARGEIVLEFSALPRVLPARHLLVFIEAEQQDSQDAGARKIAWAPVDADGRGAAQLSKRERQVMALIAHGGQSADMAASLILSPETVKTHVHHAMIKLGARTRAHAVAIAIVSGQINWSTGAPSAEHPSDRSRTR